MLANDNLLADFSRELAKLIQIGQKNAAKLDTVIKNQERPEAIVNEQKGQILEIKSKLEVAERDIEHEVEDMKVKKKGDRKSTRLNSSHSQISYAVFCLKKKK